MPQALLAFLAVTIVTGMLFGQQRLTLQAQGEAVNAQFEVMASAVASERMHYIVSHSFDARVADGTVSRANMNLNDLTSPGDFGTATAGGCIVASTCKDVDDFHEHQDTVSYAQAGEFDFAIDTEVAYVHSSGSVSVTPTWTKEISVTVRALPLNSHDPYLAAPVQKTRRASPTW